MKRGGNLKRTPFRNRGTGLVRVPLRAKGKKSSGWNRSRQWCMDRAGGLCEAGTPACPDGPHRGEHAHHRKLRSQGGSDGLDNLLWVCALAHLHIHDHPAESYARGWMIRRDAVA